MNALERKMASVITKYAAENFSEADWITVGQITGQLNTVTGHSRLVR
jgi:hypothetical protein